MKKQSECAILISMDLCIDARMAFSSGVGTYIRELLAHFVKEKLNLTLLVDQKLDFDVKQIPFHVPIYSLKEQLHFSSTIPPCDLFFSPHYNIPLQKIRAKKRVATIHDVYHLAHGSFSQKIYARWMMHFLTKKTDRIITVSKFSEKEIERFLGKQNVSTIPIGVNVSRFKRRLRSEKIRQKYHLPKKFALFVGNNKPHKNLQSLEKAFRDISQIELVLVGKGTTRGVVDDEDLASLYSMAEMFIFPSFYEGFGLPPLEAMCCGCPTLVANVASIPEVCGDASLYFNPHNVEEIKATITTLLEKPEMKKELVLKGYQRAKMFDWKECARAHLALFEEVLHA